MADESVRRALYVLFARLLAEPPDAALYARLRDGGLERLAEAQGIDLSSDLLASDDPEAAAAELSAEYSRLALEHRLRASAYTPAASDPAAAISGFLAEHELGLDESTDLPMDHLAIALGIMGELARQSETGGTDEQRRARAFFLRHLDPWAQRALTELAQAADRNFYRGVAAMLSAFLETERRLLPEAV